MWVLCLHACMYTGCMLSVHGGQKRASGWLWNHRLDDEHQTWGLWKSKRTWLWSSSTTTAIPICQRFHYLQLLLIYMVKEGTEARQHCPLLLVHFSVSHTCAGERPHPFLCLYLQLSLSFIFLIFLPFCFFFHFLPFSFPHSFLLLLHLPKPRGRLPPYSLLLTKMPYIHPILPLPRLFPPHVCPSPLLPMSPILFTGLTVIACPFFSLVFILTYYCTWYH